MGRIIFFVLLLVCTAAAHASDTKVSALKEPDYKSEKPLYLRIAFGDESGKIMWGVIDESEGTGKGYDIVYLDVDMDLNLKNNSPIKFPKAKRRSDQRKYMAKFSFDGPMGDKKGKYTLDIYALGSVWYKDKPLDKTYFRWDLDIEGWNYHFINGLMGLYASVDKAFNGKPVRLGVPCKWEINHSPKEFEMRINVGLKDKNGCTLRSLRNRSGRLSPQLTLLSGKKVVKEAKMEFG